MSWPGAPRSTALARRTASSSSTSRPGRAARTSAATPVTCGAAMLVPDSRTYPPPGAVEMSSTPGAAMSTARPVLEKSAIVLCASTALTDTTPRKDAGYCRICVPSLPEAATVRIPASRAAVNVGCAEGDLLGAAGCRRG